jgi:quinolinate synthase
VLKLADYIGSTSGLLKFSQQSSEKSFIVVTEAGILHQMQLNSPDKEFIPAPPDNQCACNECPHMKRNTLEKLFICLRYETPEIIMDEDLRKAALKPMEIMLEISSNAGL